jgi:hypothetical protein
MRVSLTPDNAEFVKQIADLRRFLNRMEATGTQNAMKARLMRATMVEFLNALRSELRQDGHDPREVMNAVAELVGNIIMSTVQSALDAPPEVQKETVGRIIGASFDVAIMTVDADERMARDAAANAKPKLALVNPDATKNILPFKKG